eukprot:scaffold1533_cov157-Amphora_coffeaeformis.AAC.2
MERVPNREYDGRIWYTIDRRRRDTASYWSVIVMAKGAKVTNTFRKSHLLYDQPVRKARMTEGRSSEILLPPHTSRIARRAITLSSSISHNPANKDHFMASVHTYIPPSKNFDTTAYSPWFSPPITPTIMMTNQPRLGRPVKPVSPRAKLVRLGLSDHDENVHESEHSIATITTGRISKETTEGSLSEDLCTELIQETWKKLLQSQKNDKKALGMQLVANMLKIKPSCSTSLGVSSSSERTPRFAELGAKLGDLLDQLVQSMGPDLCDEDLAEEWIEEGLDALLVQKAVIRCLEESLDSDEYSFEAAQAWSTTFKDTLQKLKDSSRFSHLIFLDAGTPSAEASSSSKDMVFIVLLCKNKLLVVWYQYNSNVSVRWTWCARSARKFKLYAGTSLPSRAGHVSFRPKERPRAMCERISYEQTLVSRSKAEKIPGLYMHTMTSSL